MRRSNPVRLDAALPKCILARPLTGDLIISWRTLLSHFLRST